METNNEIITTEETEVIQTTISTRRSKSKPLIATNDAGLLSQSEFLLEVWLANPTFRIGRASVEEFTEWIELFKNAGNKRRTTSGSRTDVTERLGKYDVQINKKLRYAKHYAEEVHDYENVKAHYYKYGITYSKNNGYTIVSGRDERLIALLQLINQLTAIAYIDNKYGANYWQAIYDEYEVLLKQSKVKEGMQSVSSGTKKEYRTKIRTALRDIAAMIELLHPDNYVAVQKEWGFLRSRN